MITVECFGPIRHRTGFAEVTLAATTVRDVLEQMVRRYPTLSDLVFPTDGKAHILISLNGERFLGDHAAPLDPGSRVLLLSADAGG